MIFVPSSFSLATLAEHGQGYQDLVVIEELSELIKSITKDDRFGNNGANIIEELGDVYVCLKYLAISRGISEEDIQAAIYEKIERYMKKGDTPTHD